MDMAIIINILSSKKKITPRENIYKIPVQKN